MSDAARRIARAAKRQAEKATTFGKTKLGVVVDTAPIYITPMGGAVTIPQDAMIWSNAALQTRDDWNEGDTVALSLLDDGVYLVHDVIDTGAVLGGGGPGVSDHGALTGLGDDDHTQYHTDARGDARYWQLTTDLATQAELDAHKSSSDHDGRYYTESEVDSLLGSKQPLDSDLTTIAGLTATTDNFMQAKAGAWASRTVAQVVTDLVAGGLLASSTAASTYMPLAGGTGTGTWDLDAATSVLVPTVSENDNSTKAASTAYVDRATGNASTVRPAARVSRSTAQSIGASSWTKLQWTTEDFDTDSMADVSGANTKLTVQTTGVYQISATVNFGAASGAQRYMRLLKNGNVVCYGSSAPGTTAEHAHMVVTHLDSATAADYFEVEVLQATAGSLNTAGNGTPMTFSAAWVGGTGSAWGNAGASVYQNAALSHTSTGNWQAVTWDSELWDIDGFHSTSSNTDRFTCITPGKYLVTANVIFLSNASGRRLARIRKVSAGGTTTYHGYAEKDPISGDVTPVAVAGVVDLSTGDYIVIDAYQTSGGSLGYSVGAASSGSMQVSISRVGYQTNPADLPGTYVASMLVANSGSPTHTSNGGWQKVGSGGGTVTWTNDIDKRPSGVSAQVDTSTNKRIDIRKTGLYRVNWSVCFTSIADAKLVASGVYKNGSIITQASDVQGAASQAICNGTQILSLTSGDYLELYAYQADSASEAYYTGSPTLNFIQIEYLGAAS